MARWVERAPLHHQVQFVLLNGSMSADHFAENGTFEFDALRHAVNYRQALLGAFRPFLHGRVLEVGAGIGQMSELLAREEQISELALLEPNSSFVSSLKKAFPQKTVVEGTLQSLPHSENWDGIVSINVLEHIERDENELRLCKELLSRNKGWICLFVPARPEIYAPIDRDLGHFRRYTRRELARKLEHAGFQIARLGYFNLVGYFLWWFNFCILKERRFNSRSVRLFDRGIFPVTNFLERPFSPPFGQSLLAVGRVP